MMQEDTKEREQCMFAALETGVRLRAPQAGGDTAGAVEQTIARIEAEWARIQAHDLSAVEGLRQPGAGAGHPVRSARKGLHL